MKRTLSFLLVIACIGVCALGYTRGRSERIILGDERSDLYLPLLSGQRVALLSNQTGIIIAPDGSRQHVLDRLLS
ncbi:MAG: hypothetical protein J6T76_04225, partial [Paludibacteraceae bacterium]|nr:hypothetical protein [Paludibacteraceae bacterium]